MAEGKYQTVIIDTANGLMNNLYLDLLRTKGKANFDEWRDFALDIIDLYDFLKRLPCDLVQISGYEGTGKTMGGKYLDPETNAWQNADEKALSFYGANKMYPPDNSRKNYSQPRDFEKLKANITAINTNKKSKLIVFLLCHIEDYKSGDGEIHQRMKTLGKMATKFNVDGQTVHNYYTWVDPNKDDPAERFKLRTHGTGYNTGRSPEGYWDYKDELFIPNNYQLIVDKILADR